MSRTYRNEPRRFYRHPRGHKRAVVGGSRKKSIPPTSRDDDARFSKETHLPWKAARRMLKKGISFSEIVKRLSKKFKMDKTRAQKIALISKNDLDCHDEFITKYGNKRQRTQRRKIRQFKYHLSRCESHYLRVTLDLIKSDIRNGWKDNEYEMAYQNEWGCWKTIKGTFKEFESWFQKALKEKSKDA